MKQDLDSIRGFMAVMQESAFENFLQFAKKARENGRAGHPEVVILAYSMADTEKEEYKLLIHFGDVRDAWDALMVEYQVFGSREESETVDGSFLKEFMEKIVRPRLENMSHPWSRMDRILSHYVNFLDSLFRTFDKQKAGLT